VHAFSGSEPVRLDDARRAGDGEPLSRGNARCRQHLFCERLRAFDRRRRGARPEDRDARVAEQVGDTGHERRLRPDDDQVGVERVRQREQALAVLGANRMTLAERRDPRAPRGSVEVGQEG